MNTIEKIGYLLLFAVLFGCNPEKDKIRPTTNVEPLDKTIYPHVGKKGQIWEHIAQNYRFAQDCEFYGVPACIALAQSILESGGGASIMSKHYNYFGHRSFPLDEAHYYKGKRIKSESGQLWRAYECSQEAYEEHARFFINTRQWDAKTNRFKYPYQHLICKDWREWVKGLHIYSASNDYGQQLERIIKDYQLEKYNIN